MINGGIKVNVDDDFDLLSFRVIIEFFVKVDVIDNLDFLGSKFVYCWRVRVSVIFKLLMLLNFFSVIICMIYYIRFIYRNFRIKVYVNGSIFII